MEDDYNELEQHRLKSLLNILKLYTSSDTFSSSTLTTLLTEIVLLKDNTKSTLNSTQLQQEIEKDEDYKKYVLSKTELEFENEIEGVEGVCPISKQKIVEPYKAKCGHVFDKKSLKMYSKSFNCKCPVVGCKSLI